MAHAPIALFVHDRLAHAQRTVASLLRNPGAALSDLYVFSDGPRTPQKQAAVDSVRRFVSGISGFRSVRIVRRAVNYGLARSIIEGVSQVLAESDRLIVLEDDMVTSPHFLAYMNEALDRFRDDDRVVSVHGYVYPVRADLPEAFFLQGADCWGWGTWRRGWSVFNPDGRALLDELTRRKLLHAFDFNASHPYSDMLREQIAGRNDSWAIRWYASAFLADKLTLYPGRSLVHNIGNDSSGTHAVDTDTHDARLSGTPIDLRRVPVAPSGQARAAFEAFFRSSSGGLLQRAVRMARQTVARMAR
ncbi:MAG: glycosyltransferase [Pseudomonadota bacterium]